MKATLLFLFLLCSSLSLLSQKTDLRLASDVWPPFTNEEGQTAFAKALVNEALGRAKITTQTEILPFSEVIEGIYEEKFDGSAALWRDAYREQFLLFSEPYLENRLILVGREGSDVSASLLSELGGKKVAIVENYAYGTALQVAVDVEFVPGPSNQDNLDRLLAGEVDYMLVEDLLIHYLLSYQPEDAENYLEVGRKPLITRSLHFALRKDLPRAEYYIQQFNRHIKDMVADGTYHRILQLNWISMDVDGDGQVELVLGGKNAGVLPPTSSYAFGLYGNPDTLNPNNDRFFVDGRVYQGWENVPDEYKREDVTEEDLNRPGLSLLRFRF